MTKCRSTNVCIDRYLIRGRAILFTGMNSELRVPVKHYHHVGDDSNADDAQYGKQQYLHGGGGVYRQLGALAPLVRLARALRHFEL